MQISVRSYLTLGTAAVVGATAIAMTPALPDVAAHTAHLPAPAIVEVSLTGSSFSLTDVVGLIGNLGNLGNLDLGGLIGNLDLGNLDLGGLIGNLDLGNLDLGGLIGNLGDLDLGGLVGGLSPSLVRAVVFEFLKEAAPVVRSAAGDVVQYVTSSVGGLVIGPNSIPAQFGSAIVAIPAAVMAAFGELKDRDFAAALQTLNQGLFAPITSIGEVLLETANGIKTFVSTQVGTLVAAIPGILMSAIAAVIGNSGEGALGAINNLINRLLPAEATSPASLVVAPKAAAAALSEEPAPGEAVAAVAAEAPATAPVRTPSADSAVHAAVPAAAAEQAAPQADEAPAPVSRSRAAAVRSAIADEVSNGPAVPARTKPTQRAGGQDTGRPAAAAASRGR